MPVMCRREYVHKRTSGKTKHSEQENGNRSNLSSQSKAQVGLFVVKILEDEAASRKFQPG